MLNSSKLIVTNCANYEKQKISFTARCSGMLGQYIYTDAHIDTKGFAK